MQRIGIVGNLFTWMLLGLCVGCGCDARSVGDLDVESTEVAMAGSGARLFELKCKLCHLPEGAFHRIGGDLYPSLKLRTASWLIGFVTNSDSMVNVGDSAAISNYRKYPLYAQHLFKLSERELVSLKLFIERSVETSDVRY